jgi:hypothetical protein
MAASQDMYNATQGQAQPEGGDGQAQGAHKGAEDVTDEEFEEVK